MDGNDTLLEGDQMRKAGHRGADQPDSLLGGQLLVRDDPGILLADVGVLVQVLVQPGAREGPAEGQLVQAGGAGRDDDAVELEVLDLLLDERLAGIGADEHVGRREDDIRKAANLFGHSLHIHDVGDVAAAVADEDADTRLLTSSVPRRMRLGCILAHGAISSASV
jgi:hypothetical protein